MTKCQHPVMSLVNTGVRSEFNNRRSGDETLVDFTCSKCGAVVTFTFYDNVMLGLVHDPIITEPAKAAKTQEDVNADEA